MIWETTPFRGISFSHSHILTNKRTHARTRTLSPSLMAAAAAETPNGGTKEEEKGREGRNLLGKPNFKELENGRFRCTETGHEMPSKVINSYANSKRCRIGLIDHALTQNKPPLNMFKQDPLSRSKLICKLTGDTINKSEEHIWKHINGKRFLNKLEQKEAEKLTPNGVKQSERKPQKVSKLVADDTKKNKKKNKEKDDSVDKLISKPRKCSDVDSDSEEADFWMPPVGSRWDFDDGGDRWGSGSDSEDETDEVDGTDDVDGECRNESTELSKRAKRMSIEVGPSSFASRKKKSKTESSQ
ncbi:uncharacterized protein LOC131167987 [Malania oleifera]|uniref:uncharacterized protein LOC131167987 n=1 Tax=Malania oleifera TaxID=397392 RepID=UPI0025AEAEC4|nr:uncharacterized protein LOC131167987 [Malania oleifera]